jgi:DNA-binding NarL/FixJ family response regulator
MTDIKFDFVASPFFFLNTLAPQALSYIGKSWASAPGTGPGRRVMRVVVIVDWHGLYLSALGAALAAILTDHHILVARSLACARHNFRPDGKPELALIDMTTPDVSWEILRLLRQQYPKTRLVAMSHSSNRIDALRALENGLTGFISKSQSDEEIFGAITDVLSGRIYVPPNVIHLDEAGSPSVGVMCPPSTPELNANKLTPRQRAILPLIAQGMSNKEIARALKIAVGTTKIHASSLLRILGVRNRTEAAVIARNFILDEKGADSTSVTLVENGTRWKR